MYPSLMGTFDFPAPSLEINVVLNVPEQSTLKVDIFHVISFQTSYFEDLLNIPPPSTSGDILEHIEMEIPFSIVEISYRAIQGETADKDPSPALTEEVDLILEAVWDINYSNTHDCLDIVIPSWMR
jgi:hypothetical protein